MQKKKFLLVKMATKVSVRAIFTDKNFFFPRDKMNGSKNQSGQKWPHLSIFSLKMVFGTDGVSKRGNFWTRPNKKDLFEEKHLVLPAKDEGPSMSHRKYIANMICKGLVQTKFK